MRGLRRGRSLSGIDVRTTLHGVVLAWADPRLLFAVPLSPGSLQQQDVGHRPELALRHPDGLSLLDSEDEVLQAGGRRRRDECDEAPAGSRRRLKFDPDPNRMSPQQLRNGGRLRLNEWTTPYGERRSKLQVVADDVTFLDKPKNGKVEAGEGNGSNQAEEIPDRPAVGSYRRKAG